MIEKYAKFEIQSVTPLEGKRIKCEDLILSWTPGLSLVNCVRMELVITIIHLNLNVNFNCQPHYILHTSKHQTNEAIRVPSEVCLYISLRNFG